MEKRVVDPTTGGEKGQKLARFDLVPPDALWAVAEHYGRGAEKYADRNWERGYRWGLSYGALQRHAHAFWAGESVDPETGSHHLAAVVFHALALMTFEAKGLGTDDRGSVADAQPSKQIADTLKEVYRPDEVVTPPPKRCYHGVNMSRFCPSCADVRP